MIKMTDAVSEFPAERKEVAISEENVVGELKDKMYFQTNLSVYVLSLSLRMMHMNCLALLNEH